MKDDLIVAAETFDVLADIETCGETIIGLRANPINGQSVLFPMTLEICESVGRMLLAHVRHFAPSYTTATPSHARMMRYPLTAGTK